jgi:arylsulfatase A-like enzyme
VNMTDASPKHEGHREHGRIRFSAVETVMVAIALGLCGGYLDLLMLVLRKYCWNERQYYWTASDFPWSVPVVHALLLGLAGIVVATVNRIGGKRLFTARAASWMFATLAVWSALLRTPLFGLCTLLLAAGVGRPIATAVVAFSRHPRRTGFALGTLLALLIVLASLSSGVRTLRRYHAISKLPAPATGARNVLMIVWDTVRAPSMSLYGYDRENTPSLQDWARKGVRHNLAIAPATWTYPSHSSMFTGLWPYQLNSQWNLYLDTPAPTLAEFLATRGYYTVGFAGNTRCCAYETGLDRGFIDYEDYPLTARFLLGRTIPGVWILMNILSSGDFYGAKWINLQSRDARGITDGFLDWLTCRQPDRPFFAFLNFYDAHNPYVPPPERAGRFGTSLRYPEDYQFLHNFKMDANDPNWKRNLTMARDSYDDCIASVDHEFGRLMRDLRRRGLLKNTLVIITGDHGESFGDHFLFSHGTGLYIDQVAVPLVILSPDAPAGLIVKTPVSLRDVPATVVDQLGLSAGSPFPGHSLAAFWSTKPDQPPPVTSPAFSELVGSLLEFERHDRPSRRGLQMSVLTSGWQYIRDGTGRPEQIYDLTRDMGELDNLAKKPEVYKQLDVLRRTLLDVLDDNPGSTEVEDFYLQPYRQELKALVESTIAHLEPTISASTSP